MWGRRHKSLVMDYLGNELGSITTLPLTQADTTATVQINDHFWLGDQPEPQNQVNNKKRISVAKLILPLHSKGFEHPKLHHGNRTCCNQ